MSTFWCLLEGISCINKRLVANDGYGLFLGIILGNQVEREVGSLSNLNRGSEKDD